jgi:hypothetical protein
MTDFDIFWATYPRRVAKGDARKAWSQTERIRPALPELLEAIDQQMKSPGQESWPRAGNWGSRSMTLRTRKNLRLRCCAAR